MLKNFLAVQLPPNAGNKDKIFAALNILIPVLMGIYIFVTPLPLSSINEICFYLSCTSLIILLFFKKTDFTLRSPMTLPFALFFLWAVFGLLFTLDFKNSLHDLRGHLLYYLIIFYLLVNYFNSQKKLEMLSLVVIVGASVFALWVLIKYYFIGGNSFSTRVGLNANFQEMPCINLGFITVFAITLAFNRLQNSKEAFSNLLLLVPCVFILFIAIMLTQSRATLIGLFAALVILCFNNRKIVIAIITILILAYFMPGLKDRFDPEKTINDERVKVNRLAMEVVKAHPLVGIGFGMNIYSNPNLIDLKKMNSKLPAQYRQESIIPFPHNTIMDITVRTGIIGLILFVYMLLVSSLMLWKTFGIAKSQYFRSWAICLFACLTSFLIQSLSTDTTFGSPVIVFYTILAMTNILWNLAKWPQTQEIIVP